ncbi:unnamed protein product [Schistosoma bovis]|nr:unnamed protein product [Schistosoma bovis]
MSEDYLSKERLLNQPDQKMPTKRSSRNKIKHRNQQRDHLMISEITTRLLKPFRIDVAYKPVKSLQSILCKPKDEMKKERKTEYHIQNKLFRVRKTLHLTKRTRFSSSHTRTLVNGQTQ